MKEVKSPSECQKTSLEGMRNWAVHFLGSNRNRGTRSMLLVAPVAEPPNIASFGNAGWQGVACFAAAAYDSCPSTVLCMCPPYAAVLGNRLPVSNTVLVPGPAVLPQCQVWVGAWHYHGAAACPGGGLCIRERLCMAYTNPCIALTVQLVENLLRVDENSQLLGLALMSCSRTPAVG